MAGTIFDELGRQGQKRYGGTFFEEFLKELQGRRGIEAYREMSENDDIIGAVLFAIKLLIRQTTWSVQPGGNSAKDKEAAQFVYGCMDDMQETWSDTISEILSFLTYGWSAHEIVYKRRLGQSRDPRKRSKYNDALIGWRKLPIRGQDTLFEWRFDAHDDLVSMVQMPPPDFALIEIPAERLLLFRTESRKGNPEGRSILRNAYRDWYFKKKIQEIEGIGMERDLAGFPILTAPEALAKEGFNLWDPDDPAAKDYLARAEALVQNVRRDSMEGLVMPFGWDFKLLSTGGRRQFDTNTIIERYDSRIAMTVLADFVLLGHQNTGSWALSSDKTELFSMAIGAFLDSICSVFNNKAIPKLIDLNGEHFKGITDYPWLDYSDIETPDLGQLGSFLQSAVSSGALTPDEGVERYIRDIAGLPELMGGYGGGDAGPGQTRNPSAGAGKPAVNVDNGGADDGTENLPTNDKKAAKAAKRRLRSGERCPST